MAEMLCISLSPCQRFCLMLLFPICLALRCGGTKQVHVARSRIMCKAGLCTGRVYILRVSTQYRWRQACYCCLALICPHCVFRPHTATQNSRRLAAERCCCSSSAFSQQPTSERRRTDGMQRLQAVSMAPSREASDTGGQWEDADAGLRPTERVGVLLLNLGGPETLADVEPFLYNLFADDSIIRLPPYGEISAHAACAATL